MTNNNPPKVVSLHTRSAYSAGAFHRPSSSRPWLLIIDSPKTYLLAAFIGAVALLLVGAKANDLLKSQPGLVCKAPPATAQAQAAPYAATDGSSDSTVRVDNAVTAI